MDLLFFEETLIELKEKEHNSVIILDKEVKIVATLDDLKNMVLDDHFCHIGNYYFDVDDVLLILDNTLEVERIVDEMGDLTDLKEKLSDFAL